MAEQQRWDTWPAVVTSGKHVGQMLEWIRWKTRRKVQLVIAIGANKVAVAKDEDLDAEEAIRMLETEQDTISEVLRYLQQTGQPSGAKARPDAR